MRREIALSSLLIAGSVDADRLPPHTTQQAVIGCWNVRQGATLRLAPFGKHSVKAKASFTVLPKGGPAVMTANGQWIESAGAFDVPCRPRSQHGSFCHVSPDPNGLRVRVYAIHYNDRTRGKLVEDFVATRCAP